jgi:hypothetical protein
MRFAGHGGPGDTYPVGFRKDIGEAWRAGRIFGWRSDPGTLRRQQLVASFRRHWRRKSYWNGYLAEPRSFPPGLTRCGSGWTYCRAVRDLRLRIERLPEEARHEQA